MPKGLDIPPRLETGAISTQPLRIYTGILGQIGDIVMFTATVRRLRQLFPNSQITFAVSSRYREAGELIEGLPYVDRLFVTELYFEKLTEVNRVLWERGWPVELRGDDEIEEQSQHDLILETRPRHRYPRWWEFNHQVAEQADMVGVPGPIDLHTEIAIPKATRLLPGTHRRVVLHNDPVIDPRKAWPWESVREFVRMLEPQQVVLLGKAGEPVPGAFDLRGRTTLAEAAAVIQSASCFVGIDSGPMWIAGSVQVPTVGLYGTAHIPAYGAVYPANPRAVYLQGEGSLSSISVSQVAMAVRQVLSREKTGKTHRMRIARD
jgi:ADP-heptose:LPS heptosyltransferase